MKRQVRRDNECILNTFKKKAIKDMTDWVLSLESAPSQAEIVAFKAGYVAGFNRRVGQGE